MATIIYIAIAFVSVMFAAMSFVSLEPEQ